MKTKMYVLAALLMASMVNVMADDDVKIADIYTSSGQELSVVAGERDFYISKDNEYIAALQVGNRIEICGFDVAGDCHAYIGDYNPAVHFPGSDNRATSSLPISFYLTEDFIASIKAHDFRLHGNGAKINYITLYRGKHDVPGAIKFGKTIWTGYFWMDSWTTLEMFKEAFNGIDLSKYRAIRFYHEAGRTDFVMNIIQAWGDPGVKIADQSNMTKTNEYFELPLDETMRGKFTTFMSSGEGTLKIQCDKGSGAAFNFTDVVLMPKSPEGCDNCFYVY